MGDGALLRAVQASSRRHSIQVLARCPVGEKAGLLDMMPAKRAATADEIAQTILFLASDKARFLTGQCIAVDGGYKAQ